MMRDWSPVMRARTDWQGRVMPVVIWAGKPLRLEEPGP
jgi:hypothetical protein